jgi:hypothetical protein
MTDTTDAGDWIRRYAEALGVEPPDDSTIDILLELAGVAAHASERTAAPITCYLVGQAGIEAAQALDLGRRLAGETA